MARELGESRAELHSSKLDPEERKRLLHEDASEEAFEASAEIAATRNVPVDLPSSSATRSFPSPAIKNIDSQNSFFRNFTRQPQC